MSIDRNAKICMTLKSDSDVDLFKSIMVQNKIKNITTFTNSTIAYENATRTQYDLFLTSISLNDQPGIVLLQKLRACGNYGLEPHLFIGDAVDSETVNLFAEHGIEYVITKPYSPDKIINKLMYIFKQESNLSPAEAAYRNAKSALQSKMPDMALEMAMDAEKQFGSTEKLSILLGEIALSQGDIMKAREQFQAALNTNQNSLAAQHKIAATYMANKEYSEAKPILDRLATENPHHIQVLENAGLTSLETGDFKKAKKYMGQLQTIDEGNKTATSVITRTKIEEGEFNGLAQDLKKTHTEKELVSLLNSAGIKLSKEDKIQEAINIYLNCLEVIETADFAGKVHYNLGLAYNKLGKEKQAVFHLERTLDNIPGMEKASVMLNKLKKKLVA